MAFPDSIYFKSHAIDAIDFVDKCKPRKADDFTRQSAAAVGGTAREGIGRRGANAKRGRTRTRRDED